MNVYIYITVALVLSFVSLILIEYLRMIRYLDKWDFPEVRIFATLFSAMWIVAVPMAIAILLLQFAYYVISHVAIKLAKSLAHDNTDKYNQNTDTDCPCPICNEDNFYKKIVRLHKLTIHDDDKIK